MRDENRGHPGSSEEWRRCIFAATNVFQGNERKGLRNVIKRLEYQTPSYLSSNQQPLPLCVSLTLAMAEETSTSSILMTPLPSSLGRRDVGLRTVNDTYDEERAETLPRIRVGSTKSTQESFRRNIITYLRVKFKSCSLTSQNPSQEPPRGTQKLLERIEDHPQGYPQLAAFVDCDSRKFLMCRSFMYSRIRHLLYCQAELAQLQEGLIEQDEEDSKSDKGKALLTSRKRYAYRNKISPRQALINKIGPKLKEYDDLVERTIKFASLRAPDARDLEGLKTWIELTSPLSYEEKDHLVDGTDFVALVEKQEECWLDNVVERALMKCLPRDSIFTSPKQRLISNDPSIRLRSKDRIDVLIRIVLTITAVSMLIGPSAVLYTVNGHNVLKLLLIGAFTVLFSVALHAFSKARRHENFAATSA
ncbi:hypothetical protein BDR22DRAFT_194992 [Usnea florida]